MNLTHVLLNGEGSFCGRMVIYDKVPPGCFVKAVGPLTLELLQSGMVNMMASGKLETCYPFQYEYGLDNSEAALLLSALCKRLESHPDLLDTNTRNWWEIRKEKEKNLADFERAFQEAKNEINEIAL